MKEIKIYVGELPKSCWDCPCFDSYELQCQINYADCENLDIAIERHKDCPLHSIKDHDRELVAKVCEKIKEHLSEQKKSLKDTFSPYSNGKAFIISAVEDNLNKIEKEFEK